MRELLLNDRITFFICHFKFKMMLNQVNSLKMERPLDCSELVSFFFVLLLSSKSIKAGKNAKNFYIRPKNKRIDQTQKNI